MRNAKTTPDGRVIAARKPNAQVPHPHPRHQGKLVETKGVNEIMLETGDILTECDTCGKVFEIPRSAVAHLPSHNPDRRGPRYPERVLRLIARQVAIAGGIHQRGAAQAVADLLNEQKISMVKGGQWTAGAIGHVYHKYCKELRVRIPRTTGEPETERAAVVADAPVGGEDLAGVAVMIRNAAEGLATIGQQLVKGAEDLGAVAQTLAGMANQQVAVDPEIVEKARKWDKFKEMMGE